jgi:hypothetical protein
VSNVPTIDEQLNRLDDEIRKLKIEYDIYFNGGSAKPPYDSKYRVETMIKRIFELRGMTFGQRFKYNSLVARYNVYKELWRRNIKEREEIGRPREVEAVKEFTPSTIRCSSPADEPEKVRELFDSLVSAKRSCGDSVQGLSYERFQQMIQAQVRQIKDKLGCSAIDFTVEVNDGAVKFKAKASK